MEAKIKPIDGRNWESIQRELTRPFVDEEVYWRADRGSFILCYVDARAVQQRLDDVVGLENWKCRYREQPSGRLICGISIRINKEWVEKEDGAGNPSMRGQNSESHEAKGGISGAFKRAAVPWGIARHLYYIGDTEPTLSNRYPADVPKCRIIKIKGQYGVAPSLRDIQFHLYSYDELVRHIEDPRERRIERLRCVGRRENLPNDERKAIFEAASAKWVKGSPVEPGVAHPNKASDALLGVASQRLAEWSEKGVIKEMMKAYAEWRIQGGGS